MKIDYKQLGLWLVCLALFVILGMVCPFKLIFGTLCPTCGMTSAWKSVLKGDISYAFQCHELFFLGPVIVFLVCCDFKNTRLKNWLLIGIGFCFLVHMIANIV